MELTELFNNYEQKLQELQDLRGDGEIRRSLRLFDIRFRLALDTSIHFKGEVSLTKTKIVRETYQILIPLLEMWNVYECLVKYVVEIYPELKNKESPYKKLVSILPQEAVKELKLFSEGFKCFYESDMRVKKDVDEYFHRISNNECIGKDLKENCNRFYRFINSETKHFPTYEILGLIYAERNMYYHNGETAKMGISYKNRKTILGYYYKLLPVVILQIVSSTITSESEAIE